MTFELILLQCADDPEASHVQHHRDFLKEHVVFKEVFAFTCLFLYYGRMVQVEEGW